MTIEQRVNNYIELDSQQRDKELQKIKEEKLSEQFWDEFKSLVEDSDGWNMGEIRQVLQGLQLESQYVYVDVDLEDGEE